MPLLTFYKDNPFSKGTSDVLQAKIKAAAPAITLKKVSTEFCFYVEYEDANSGSLHVPAYI